MGHRVARTLVRAGAVGVLSASVGLGGVAFADEPETWQQTPHVSGLEFLLVLFLVPAGLFVVIFVLSALPSLMGGGRGYQPGRPWLGEGEWFGGPHEGIEAADDGPKALERAGDQGGTGARY